jgi:hypothetical protein
VNNKFIKVILGFMSLKTKLTAWADSKMSLAFYSVTKKDDSVGFFVPVKSTKYPIVERLPL